MRQYFLRSEAASPQESFELCRLCQRPLRRAEPGLPRLVWGMVIAPCCENVINSGPRKRLPRLCVVRCRWATGQSCFVAGLLLTLLRRHHTVGNHFAFGWCEFLGPPLCWCPARVPPLFCIHAGEQLPHGLPGRVPTTAQAHSICHRLPLPKVLAGHLQSFT